MSEYSRTRSDYEWRSLSDDNARLIIERNDLREALDTARFNYAAERDARHRVEQERDAACAECEDWKRRWRAEVERWQDDAELAQAAEAKLRKENERLLLVLSDIADTSSDARTVGAARAAIRQSYPGEFTSTFDKEESERKEGKQ